MLPLQHRHHPIRMRTWARDERSEDGERIAHDHYWPHAVHLVPGMFFAHVDESDRGGALASPDGGPQTLGALWGDYCETPGPLAGSRRVVKQEPKTHVDGVRRSGGRRSAATTTAAELDPVDAALDGCDRSP